MIELSKKDQAYYKLDSILHKVCFPEACQNNDYPPISIGSMRIHLYYQTQADQQIRSGRSTVIHFHDLLQKKII